MVILSPSLRGHRNYRNLTGVTAQDTIKQKIEGNNAVD
jgi:hypothetical protein